MTRIITFAAMEHLSDPLAKKLYRAGYAFGLNPVFSDYENFSKIGPKYRSEAFFAGFETGRSEYERMNGSVSDGIPSKIVTAATLNEYFMLGMTGMSFCAEAYTPFQRDVLERSYRNGLLLCNPDHDIELFLILAERDIFLTEK